MTENERLTHACGSGIKSGYWSSATKAMLTERLAAYENSGLLPEEISDAIKKAGDEGQAKGLKLFAECLAGASREMLGGGNGKQE